MDRNKEIPTFVIDGFDLAKLPRINTEDITYVSVAEKVAELDAFITKIIEKAIATQIHSHLINNDIVDNFQSAYKAGHSCETALLRVYNDIVTTIGRGNGAMLVLLDLFAAFDTIDHDNLFAYYVLSDFANIICVVPQSSVFVCMYYLWALF